LYSYENEKHILFLESVIPIIKKMTHMKKILQTVMTGSFVILVACNDNAGKNTTSDTTATMANMDTSTAASSSAGNITSNVINKKVQLSADQEVPPNDSKGSGTADVTYNKDSKMLTYTLSWSGLTGKATMAHIHGTAAKGVNAGVKYDITPKLKKEASGSITDSLNIESNGIKEDSLMSGFYYFNIHTAKHPGGEIRGQIELQ
jgi:hypothetical protein